MDLQEFKEKIGFRETAAYYSSMAIVGLRIEEKLTQKQLAEKIGTKAESITRAENPDYYPSLKWLEKIAKKFNRKVRVYFEKV